MKNMFTSHINASHGQRETPPSWSWWKILRSRYATWRFLRDLRRLRRVNADHSNR